METSRQRAQALQCDRQACGEQEVDVVPQKTKSRGEGDVQEDEEKKRKKDEQHWLLEVLSLFLLTCSASPCLKPRPSCVVPCATST